MDFCRDVLLPKISSDKPSIDGGEVTNLISDQHGEIKNGFICESFVRAPADIAIEFPIPIDIASIVLNIEVGSRRSRGISILARFEKNLIYESSTSSMSSNLPKSEKRSSLCRSVSDSLLTKQKDKVTKDDNFVCLGKWFINKESIIILKNFHYKHSLNFSLPFFKNDSKTYMGALRHPCRSPVLAVKEIIIRILSVTPTGSPVLSSIRIWGQPSANLNSSVKNKFVQLWIKHCVNGPNQLKNKSNLCSPTSESEANKQNVDLEAEPIPEDFLDSLTFEVMTVPILLPSGNSIDMHTLEKFFANEAIWGRPPSDPFTGVCFKEGYSPEPNVHLKSRIDRFLLINKNGSVDITHYTVGSSFSSDICGHSRKRRGDKLEKDCSSTKLRKQNHSRSMSLNNCSSLGCPSTSFSGQLGSSKGPSTTSITNLKKNTSNLPPRAPRETCDTVNKTVAKNGHTLVRSLGNVLSLSSKITSKSKAGSLVTLKHRKVATITDNVYPSPNYITCGDTSLVKTFSLDSIMQGTESCQCGQKETLYILNCSHIICRNCLTARPSLPFRAVQCSQCSKISHQHKINRYHPPSIFEK